MALLRLVLLAMAAALLAAPAIAGRLELLDTKAPLPKLLGVNDVWKGKQLRVLAFGDSLTEGWIFTEKTKHPYTWRLEPMLREHFGPKGIDVQVTNGGVGSAGVLDRLNDAFLGDLKAARDAGKPYHYVVFLAGINDILLQHRAPEDIVKRMKELWAAAAREGTTTIVIPTLPTNVKEGEPARRDLVSRIRAAARAATRAGDGSLRLLDLESKFDWWAMAPAQRSKLFDDGVHLTDWGYQQYLAPLVYDGVLKAAKA